MTPYLRMMAVGFAVTVAVETAVLLVLLSRRHRLPRPLAGQDPRQGSSGRPGRDRPAGIGA